MASSSPSPLSIAVVGAGGVGSTFAFQLARAGHDVTVVARPDSTRLRQLQRDQGVVLITGERATTRVAYELDEARIYDLILVTTLNHQVEPLLPALRRSRARWVQFMFNTFNPERLQAAVGAERCGLGMPFIMAKRDSDGRLDATISSGRRTLHGEPRWAQLFEQAGLPSAHEPQMALWLRCHTPMCIGMESIAVAAERRGGGATWREADTVARAIRAGFEIVEGLGCRLYPPSKVVLSASPRPLLAAMLWTISRSASFRDLLATGEDECRALASAMVAAASAADPPLRHAADALAAASPSQRP